MRRIDLIPYHSPNYYEKKLAGSEHYIGWMLFAYHAHRDEFMRQFILSRQMDKLNYLCSWCGQMLPFRDARHCVIHHATYRGHCTYRPTLDANSGALTVPDCKTCFTENPNGFHLCSSRLFAVHANCREKIYAKGFKFKRRAEALRRRSIADLELET